jgi:predicted GIY-YIG superfamily endonuclease
VFWGDHFWAYILQNPAGRFYIGCTDDVARRVIQQIKSMKSARWIREHLLNGRVPAAAW